MQLRMALTPALLLLAFASTSFPSVYGGARGGLSERDEMMNWTLSDWVIKDDINDVAEGHLDLCNVFCRDFEDHAVIKITTRAPITPETNVFVAVSLDESDPDAKPVFLNGSQTSYRGVNEQIIPHTPTSVVECFYVYVRRAGSEAVVDSASVNLRERRLLDNETGNCAFVHHGNQGLTYTSVFRGDGGSTSEGFDEILELHQSLSAPGNFHMSGTLITAAEWYDPSFNQWLRDGISEGWVAMLTSVYAQHIMPFVQDNMNNWAVNIEYDMVQTLYNYDARVAWIPERVWLAQGHYPDAGLADPWLGDNWAQHGVDAVILDDWPHVSGNSDRKIHWMNNGSGITLRVIPIDGEFTGNCHYNPGAAIAQIQSTGQFGIVVYGTDWEAASEMADFNCPDCLENYSQVVSWAADNYPAVGVWKLDSALDNPDFNGWGIEVGNGTYGLIGGDQGYGGNNNSWYTDWAAAASHSDFHNPVWGYGQAWYETYLSVNGAPSNNLSESGWYVMMTNLHETAWHDFVGGPISGWQHRYSAHIKNANVYAEAAHWANGEYAIPINAYTSDVDKDGIQELIIHNQRVFAVFESIGGRAQWIFAKDSASGGYNYSVVGSCNTYWNETDGDYDEPSSNNHQAAFAEVSPNYRNELYAFEIVDVTEISARIRLTHNEISKEIVLESNEPYLDVSYDVGAQNCWIRHGFTPDLVDLIWNADMQRIYAPDVSYTGFRNPNTGATGALIIGNGGTSHQLEFGGTLLRGDELRGYDRFSYLLFAGPTSSPDTQGHVAELETLANLNLDHFGPRLNPQVAFISSSVIEVTFDEAIHDALAEIPANWTLSDFNANYTVTQAERQNDWRRVRLTVSPNFAGGETGTVTANLAITDLNGNPIDPNFDTASLFVPSGLTPHTIVIDGTNDFDVPNECLYVGVDTLVITWDSLALYIGYYPRDLNAADMDINIDTNQTSGMGATNGSHNRERFADPFKPEYQIFVEGGVGGLEVNRWTGAAWQIRTSGNHTATSYNGWASNPFTEVHIPWLELNHPAGIALSVNVLGESNNTTLRAFPPSNPVGNFIILNQTYRIYPPFISGPLPLMGARTKNILSGELNAPSDLVIQQVNNLRRLYWSAVPEAAGYVIYRAESSDGPFLPLDETSATTFDDDDILPGEHYFYRVTSKAGI